MKSESSLSANRQHVLIGAALLAMAAASPTLADTASDTYTWSGRARRCRRECRHCHGPVVPRRPPRGRLGRIGQRRPRDTDVVRIRTAAGVRRVTEGPAPKDDWLTLPVEFVCTELDGRYIRFSVPVPSDDLAKIASLSAGQWITATSPRRAARNEEAVVDVRPYNDVG